MENHFNSSVQSATTVPCPNCGFAIPIGATWCEGCGAGEPSSSKPSMKPNELKHGISGPCVGNEELFRKGSDDMTLMRFVILTCLWIAGLFLFYVFIYFGAWFIIGGGSFD